MDSSKENKIKETFKYIIVLLFVFISVLLVRMFAFDYFTISGHSMAPNLKDKEIVLVNKLSSKYDRGDVIIFDAKNVDFSQGKYPNDIFYVKRVIGIAGDTVEFKDGKLYVNDKLVNQDFLVDNKKLGIDGNKEKFDTGTYENHSNWDLNSLSTGDTWNKNSKNKSVVPKNSVFVLGDNRTVSSDSRMYGFVQTKYITGIVKTPFWNENSNFVNNWDDRFFK